MTKITFQVIPLSAVHDALRFMERNKKWDCSDGLASIVEVVGNGAGYVALNSGVPVLIFSISVNEWEFGRELVINVAHQVQSGQWTEKILPVIEQQFGAGCNSVLIVTKRRGLIEKIQAQGYRETGRMMRKKI